MKVRLLCTRILLSLLLGIVVTVLVMQEDPWLQDRIGSYVIREFAQSGACQLQATASKLNILYPYIEFSHVRATPDTGQRWQWQAERMCVHFSWWRLLLYGTLELQVELYGVQAESDLKNGSLGFTEHIAAFMNAVPTTVPVQLRTLSFKPGRLVITDAQTGHSYMIQIHSTAQRVGSSYSITAYVQDGNARINGHTYVQDVSGELNIAMSYQQDVLETEAQLKLNAEIPPLFGSERCYIQGAWNKGSGSCVLNNAQHTFLVNSLEVTQDVHNTHIIGKGTIPLPALLRAVYPHFGPTALLPDAVCSIGCDIVWGDKGVDVQGVAQIAALSCAGYSLDSTADLSFLRSNNGNWHGACGITHGVSRMQGSWAYNEQDATGFVHIANSTTLTHKKFPGWHSMPGLCTLHITQKEPSTVHAVCTATVEHDQTGEQRKAHLQASSKNTMVTIAGTVHDMQCSISGSWSPVWHITKAWCKQTTNGTAYCSCESNPQDYNRLNLLVQIPFVRMLAERTVGAVVQGEGALEIRLLLAETITAYMRLCQGSTVRIAPLYNCITDFQTDLDINLRERSIAVEGLSCTLQRGTVTAPRATLMFDDSYQLTYAYVPLNLDHCFMTKDSTMFTTLSGQMWLQYKALEGARLQGHLFIDQAQVKENIFASLFQKDVNTLATSLMLMPQDIACDVTLVSKEPIRIKTPLLEAKAHVRLHGTGTLHNPAIAGSIELQEGTLYFPYKPLYITKATIHCVPHQLTEPIIELVAKNKIKQYAITMHLSGALGRHDIALQSSPPLTQEQIVSLLLTGSQEESLNVIMPALIMRNITNLIFGQKYDESELNRYFKQFFRPLEHVYVIPSFSDQTGRGGLRGAIEIEINDRWRALLQKNFSLSEDTRVELEYAVSDDISLRAIRDERRDIGGEVEMRWKF